MSFEKTRTLRPIVPLRIAEPANKSQTPPLTKTLLIPSTTKSRICAFDPMYLMICGASAGSIRRGAEADGSKSDATVDKAPDLHVLSSAQYPGRIAGPRAA